MNKIAKYLLGVGVFALAPIGVSAATASAGFNCPATASPGETVSCTVSATASGATLNGMTAKYTLPSGVTYVSFTPSQAFNVNASNTAGIAVGQTTGFNDSEIGVVKFQMPTSATSNQTYVINLTAIGLSDTDYNDYTPSDIDEEIRIKSSINTLSNLTVSGATIDFNANTKVYNVTIDSDKTTIGATLTDNHAGITGTGQQKLSYGLNKFEVKVTSETGVTNTYTINITRPDNRSTNKELLDFALNNYELEFKKDKFEYEIAVENNITTLGICSDDIKQDGWLCINENYDLNSFDYDIKLNGKSIFEDTATFERQCGDDVNNCVIVYKEKDIVVGEVKDGVETYYIPVGELNDGENKLEFVMIAENETEQTYTFKIVRKGTDKDSIVENPKTGLYTGIGTLILIGLGSLLLSKEMKKKNLFPQA